MRVLIQHRSRYHYPRPTLLGPQTIRLRPADHARARIESYRLDAQPEHRIHWQRDPQGNHVARLTFKTGQRVETLELLVELAADVRPVNPFDFFIDDRAKIAPFTYPDGLATELEPYLDTGDPAYRMGREATAFLKSLPWSGDTMSLLVELNAAVHKRVAYVIRDEPGVWTPEDTMRSPATRQLPRDVSVLLVALLRQRGIAARFASGYLVQLADEGMIPDEPKGVSRDAVDLHAWAEVFVPGAGWVGFDATSGLLTGEGHIPLACTASPGHAAPARRHERIRERFGGVRDEHHPARPRGPPDRAVHRRGVGCAARRRRARRRDPGRRRADRDGRRRADVCRARRPGRGRVAGRRARRRQVAARPEARRAAARSARARRRRAAPDGQALPRRVAAAVGARRDRRRRAAMGSARVDRPARARPARGERDRERARRARGSARRVRGSVGADARRGRAAADRSIRAAPGSTIPRSDAGSRASSIRAPARSPAGC